MTGEEIYMAGEELHDWGGGIYGWGGDMTGEGERGVCPSKELIVLVAFFSSASILFTSNEPSWD